jgi:predicted oxidoreductase
MIIAGTMRWGIWGAKFTTAQYQNAIEHCLQTGINSFDHADIYGDYTTEAEFGMATKVMGLAREKYIIITKCGIERPCATQPQITIKKYNLTAKYIITQTEQSLKNLQVDYIDVLLLHRPSPLMEANEIALAFDTLTRQGKIKEAGVSNFTTAQIDYLRSAYPHIKHNQILLNWRNSSPLTNGTVQYHVVNKINTMAYSPLASLDNISEQDMLILQNLATKYNCTMAALAVSWLATVPHNIQIVIGTTQNTRITEAYKAQKQILEPNDWFAMLKIAEGKDVA